MAKAMTNKAKLARWRGKLSDVLTAQDRQLCLVGVRFGALARLTELGRERRRIERAIASLENS